MLRHLIFSSLCLSLLLIGPMANADDTLNLQNSGKVTFPDKSDKTPPLFISAEQMNGLENVFVDAQGNVDLHRGLIEVQSDHLHYLLASDQVEANGNVCVTEQGLILTGPHLDMFMQKQTGQMTTPQFTFHNPGTVPPAGTTMPPAGPTVNYARGSASQLLFEGENQYKLKNAIYTSCVVGNDDWYLHLKDLHLDMLNQVGTAHGAVIDFMQTPILYTPWISFPLDNSRKSGLLAPIFGTTSNSGASLALPFYWNIAPNMDATIAPDIISKRGIELDGEFRYLEPTYHGTFNGDILQDHMTNTTRWDIFATHDQVFAPGLTGHFVYQAVSDNNFFRDLSNQLTVTSLATLDQEASLTYQHDWWQLTGHVQQYQTLQETGVPNIIPPYAILPEVNWSGNKILDNGLNVNVYTDFARFVNPTPGMVNGDRLVAYPSVSLPINTAYGYITPKFGVNYTDYSLSTNNTSPQSQYTRTLPITSVDSGMYFDRNINIMGNQYQQTLEPRLFYVYIPYQNQNNLPVFDTAELDPINYATLFSENRYVGYDRINNANQLTMAVTSRLIDQDSGLERLRFSVGERLYFTPQLVTLPGETAITSASSDVMGDIGGQLTQAWRTDAAISYNTQMGQTDAESLSVSYQPAPGKVFNFGYLSVNGQVDQYDFSSQWPIYHHWYTVMRYDYSVLDKQLVQGLAGVEYNGGCWALRTLFQTIEIAANTQSTSFFIQLELNGLGNLGSDPTAALNLSIPGYINSNEIIRH